MSPYWQIGAPRCRRDGDGRRGRPTRWHDGSMAAESRHVSVSIDRSLAEAYTYASEPTNMPAWAPGLLKSIENVDGRWIAESGMGRLVIAFTPPNPYGVL